MIRVAISYRVLQAWRVPVFQKLSDLEGIDLCVFYSDDFEGTKVKSFTGEVQFKTIKLPSKQFTFNTKNGKAYIPYNPTLYSELKKFQPDVKIVEGASNLLNNIISFLFAKKHNKKIIQWGLGEIENRKRSFQRKVIDILFHSIERKSDAAISYSSYGSAYYQRLGMRKNSVFTAVNVVDTEKRLIDFKKYCSENKVPYPSPVPITPNLVFVGSLSENKNLELLIESFKKLSIRKNDITLTILGDGDLRPKLERMVDRYKLNSKVKFVGHQNCISPFFYNASLMILPGLGGLAISDSLIHGVPVICTIGDGCEKDLINNGNGIIIKNMTEENLTDCIDKILSSKQSLIDMRLKAQQFEFSNFNISNYVQVIQKAINHVAN